MLPYFATDLEHQLKGRSICALDVLDEPGYAEATVTISMGLKQGIRVTSERLSYRIAFRDTLSRDPRESEANR